MFRINQSHRISLESFKDHKIQKYDSCKGNNEQIYQLKKGKKAQLISQFYHMEAKSQAYLYDRKHNL